MRRSCERCHGTDTQNACEHGQCYAEEYDRQQQDEYNRHVLRKEAEYWQRRAEEEGRP